MVLCNTLIYPFHTTACKMESKELLCFSLNYFDILRRCINTNFNTIEIEIYLNWFSFISSFSKCIRVKDSLSFALDFIKR